jgi:tripeptide aminopeptidase
MNDEIRDFLRKDARERFLRYVRINTCSDPETGSHPSSDEQWVLGKLLKEELLALGLTKVELDDFCYVYGTLPASEGATGPAVTFCAHMDTSPSEEGCDVVPIMHPDYNGGAIHFPGNESLTLTPEDSPELKQFLGETIITSDGNTLLGGDDKAGIAEIMAALSALRTFDGLPHPELRIVFTPDEEIGEGADHIDLNRLGKIAYTVDGGMIGELEQECFDAWELSIIFHGRNIHPGYAKNHMVNAGAIAARFAASLPEHETPEHTVNREGFYHLMNILGDENRATLKYIIRDFDPAANLRRMEFVKQAIRSFELRYAGLKIELIVRDQYNNMREILDESPEVVEMARKAIAEAGLTLRENPIRGGTDGARFCFMGVPTPNLFSGAMMVHSKTEWIPEIALEKGAEVILHLCRLWVESRLPEELGRR